MTGTGRGPLVNNLGEATHKISVVPTESSLHIVTGLLRHFPMVLISSKGKLAGVITKQDMLKMMLG